MKRNPKETKSGGTPIHIKKPKLEKQNDEGHHDSRKEKILKSKSHNTVQERNLIGDILEIKSSTNDKGYMKKTNTWTRKATGEDAKRLSENSNTYDSGDETQVSKNSDMIENKTQSARRNTHRNQMMTEKKSKPPQIDKVALDFSKPSVHDGIVLSVIHEVKGHVLLTRTFPTWNMFAYTEDLIWWLSQLRPGRLVIMRIQKTGSRGLQKAWPILRALGSIMAPYLPLQGLWVWVFVVQGKSLLESFSFTNYHDRPLFTLQTHNFLSLTVPSNLAPDNPMEAHRWAICNRLAAMGSFCDPDNPMPLPNISTEVPKQETFVSPDVIPVVVFAGRRIQYLVYTLEKLFKSRGITSSPILVIVGTSMNTHLPDPDVIDLLTLLSIPYRVVKPLTGNFTSGIHSFLFHFYRSAITEAVSYFSWAHQIAFLDEDVEVSEDWLEYMHHTLSLLHKDKTLYCVCSVGSMGGKDPSVIRRGRLQPSWGFMVTKSFLEEALSLWDINATLLLYDSFLYEKVSRGRECVYPEVSRARHYGIGTNFEPFIHQKHFLDRKIYTGQPTQMTPLQHLILEKYDKELRFHLQSATPISREPCAPGFFPNASAEDFVFYFHLGNLNDSYSFEWTILTECVGLWAYNTLGMHQGVTELLSDKGYSIYFVGVPASPFSDLCPRNYTIWTLKDRDEDFIDQQWSFVTSSNSPPNHNVFTFKNAYSHIFDMDAFTTEDLT
ncbi:protein O-linked-mannose beta-1,2-N-acetylglucosaminyltransferase 1-like [Oratosquilla oratoria]|uniref:protein O-linked-mannose beta-1,2-N-acetylglucosaminyltransferase 1-like n=1 Tax=Oratosquilla oratoria TaxID=337810 RepID=UPI003F76D2CF